MYNNIYSDLWCLSRVKVKRTERCSVSRLNLRSGASKIDRVNVVVEYKYNCLLNKIK